MHGGGTRKKGKQPQIAIISRMTNTVTHGHGPLPKVGLLILGLSGPSDPFTSLFPASTIVTALVIGKLYYMLLYVKVTCKLNIKTTILIESKSNRLLQTSIIDSQVEWI